MTLIEIPGTSLCVDDGGSGGVPVLFVHSLAGRAGHWSFQLQHLRPERRAAALELRGHGCSGPLSEEDCSVESLSRDVETAIDGLGLKRVVMVGHSLGGTVALAYAGSHSQEVAGLLLVDPSGDPSGVPAEQMSQFLKTLQSDSYPEAIENYYRFLLTGSRTKVRDQVLQDLRETPRQTVIGLFQASLRYNPLPALHSYQGPRLSVITPFNDAPFSLHNLDPGLSHVKMTGTSHWLQMDRPEEFNRILDQFLLSVDTAERAGGGARR